MKTPALLLSLAVTSAFVLSACSKAPAEGNGDAPPALLAIAERGDLPALSALLDQRAEPDVRDACQWTPLMKAALYGHEEVARRLLAAGAHVEAVDKGGYSALMLAASNNHAALIELLHEHGADLNRQENTNGDSALIWAAKLGHTQSVSVLLSLGADASLRDHRGKTALDWARENTDDALVELLETPRLSEG